jgi:hypothetical protein
LSKGEVFYSEAKPVVETIRAKAGFSPLVEKRAKE